MQQMLSYMRRAIQDYNMISPGDHILVGVSGGKDSVVLLAGLAYLRRFLGVDFSLTALTLDMGFEGGSDYSAIEELCARLEVPCIIKPTDIGNIIFEERKEQNPCSLCARMRRGALHDAAKALGCNKVALGHHADDAVETFIMNLFNEGRVGCFSPNTYMSRKDLYVIRPMVYAWEREVVRVQQAESLPVVKSRCPADKVTNRQWTKDFLESMEQKTPGLRKRLLGAMRRGDVSGWGVPQ